MSKNRLNFCRQRQNTSLASFHSHIISFHIKQIFNMLLAVLYYVNSTIVDVVDVSQFFANQTALGRYVPIMFSRFCQHRLQLFPNRV